MDGQRANAAQMAARNIKAAKGRRKPLTSSNAQQSMSFGGGGGLFGGSVQAPGTFDFAAPGGNIAFPPPSYGSNMFSGNGVSLPDKSENESDPRADTTGEEAARRSRGFQVGDQPGLFQTPNLFGGSQVNTFSPQEKSAANPFSFTQNQTQQTTSSGFSLNTTSTQDKPAGTPFSFGTNQTAASSPVINFGAGSTQDKPGSNIFGELSQQQPTQPTQPAAPTIFNFGSPISQDKPTATPFSFGQSTTQPSSAPNFGSAPAADKPTSNIFGSASAMETATSGLFGSDSAVGKSTSNTFMVPAGEKSTNNMFGTANGSASSPFGSSPAAETPKSDIFANSQSQPASSLNLFGSIGPQSTPSTLAGFNAPASTPGNVLGQLEHKASQDVNGIFAGQIRQQKTANIFGNPKPSDGSITSGEPTVQPSPISNSFGSLDKPVTSNDIVSSTPSQNPAPAGTLFGGLNQSTSTSDLLGNLNKPVDHSLSQTKLNGALANGANTGNIWNPNRSGASGPAPSSQAPLTNLFGSSKPLFGALSSEQEHTKPNSTPTFLFGSTDYSATMRDTNGNTTSPTKPIDHTKSVTRPSPNGTFQNLPQSTESPYQSSSISMQQTPPESVNGSHTVTSHEEDANNDPFPEMTAAAEITEDFMRPLVPPNFTEEQRKEFYVSFRVRSLNRAMEGIFRTLAMGTVVSNALAYYAKQRYLIVAASPDAISSSKRKISDDEEDKENPAKRNKLLAGPSLVQLEKEPRAKSPEKSPVNSSRAFSNGNLTPKAPTLPSQPLLAPNPGPSSPSPKGKRKAETQLTKDDHEREEREGRQLKTPKLNGSTGGSNTSNIFKNILDSPAKASPEKKIATLPDSSKAEPPRFNPFSNLPVPSSPGKSASSASSAAVSSNLFAPKATSQIASSSSSKASGNPNTATTVSGAPSPIKPPNFGTGPVNFMAQFGQQASKSEEELMKKAKDEDYDSDEDEAEWEANWKKNREAELKAIEDASKAKRATFIGGKFSFGQVDVTETQKVASQNKVVEASQPPSTNSLFASSSAPQSSGNSLFGSVSGSRTPTPGLVGSSRGSVLDGHVSSKQPVEFQNIFGHLSSDDSGADSKKAQDEGSSDEETEVEEDVENKDPNYQSSREGKSGSATPVEEGGSGAASAKKPLFDFGASKSGGLFGASSSTAGTGTSSPSGGSLFDRITRDSSGNAVRPVSSEEKENTQPNTIVNVADAINPFARSFNKYSDVPADRTWKPDSPIRFGSNPIVNVTAATPTKPAASISSLFGSSGTPEQPASGTNSPKPFSNLFGSTNSPKPPPAAAGVGFNFGGTPTATSSLFPSAAASGNTSRATTPGGTTDGESAAEGDPDAEQYEQLDLTAGGPGEEDEEVLHEVRAKAVQYDGGEWKTKGVGPLRVLKHKGTNANRILLRADPRGTIVLNKSLLAGVKYELNGKTVIVPVAGGPGKGLERWILQVKTPEFAQELEKVLSSNQPSA